jgi:hypothetical protein
MVKYKLLKSQGELVNVVLRADDGTNFNTSIPYSTGNRDYREYLEWKAAGNTPEEAAD